MSIIPQFTKSDVEKEINERLLEQKKIVIQTFKYVGSQCVKKARSLNTYKDQTGNLRSSIGYMVLDDGKIVSKSAFQIVKDGSQGNETGSEFINRIALDGGNEGVVLIVVAGMNYASYVEARGFDVLTSAELLAEQKVPELLSKLGFKL